MGAPFLCSHLILTELKFSDTKLEFSLKCIAGFNNLLVHLIIMKVLGFLTNAIICIISEQMVG